MNSNLMVDFRCSYVIDDSGKSPYDLDLRKGFCGKKCSRESDGRFA
jgi:hypothetical protein